MEEILRLFQVQEQELNREQTANTQRILPQSWIMHRSSYYHGNRGISEEERKDTTIQNKESLKKGSVFRPIHFPIHIQW